MSFCYWYCQEHCSAGKAREESKQGKAARQAGETSALTRAHFCCTLQKTAEQVWWWKQESRWRGMPVVRQVWDHSVALLLPYHALAVAVCRDTAFCCFHTWANMSTGCCSVLHGPISSGQLSAPTCNSKTANTQKWESFRERVLSCLCFVSASFGCRTVLLHSPSTHVLYFHVCLPAYQLH